MHHQQESCVYILHLNSFVCHHPIPPIYLSIPPFCGKGSSNLRFTWVYSCWISSSSSSSSNNSNSSSSINIILFIVWRPHLSHGIRRCILIRVCSVSVASGMTAFYTAGIRPLFPSPNHACLRRSPRRLRVVPTALSTRWVWHFMTSIIQ